MKKLFYREMIWNYHCIKMVRIRSDFGSYFSAFGLNKERHSVSLRIQSKCGKIRTRITPNTDTFPAVILSWKRIQKIYFLYGHNNLFQIDEQLFFKKKKSIYTLAIDSTLNSSRWYETFKVVNVFFAKLTLIIIDMVWHCSIIYF